MTDYVIQPGDCLASIAQRFGFANWRTIYDHSANASFREQFPNPNVIEPGATLTIPDKVQGEQSASSGSKHTYRVSRPKTMLRIKVLDRDQEPLANAGYKLTVGERTHTGSADGNGLIEQEILATAAEVHLTVFAKAKTAQNQAADSDVQRRYDWRLLVGQLDPVTTVAGYQARIHNLGIETGPIDGIHGPLTNAGVRAFQTRYDLAVDGIVGPQTRGKLLEVYDGQ